MKKPKRHFISVYFQDGLAFERKKRDVTLSFSEEDDLYHQIKSIGSTEIKELLGIYSYTKLVEGAKKESRTLSNYIKYKLRNRLKHE